MDNDQKAEIEHAEAIVYTLTEQDVVDANKLNFLATYRKARTYRAWLGGDVYIFHFSGLDDE